MHARGESLALRKGHLTLERVGLEVKESFLEVVTISIVF